MATLLIDVDGRANVAKLMEVLYMLKGVKRVTLKENEYTQQLSQSVGMVGEEKVVYKIKKKPSDFAGTLSKKKSEDLLNYINQSRKQWDRDF